MQIIFSLLILLISFSVKADEVKIEVNPPKPVAGEVFQVLFRVFTESDQEPSINFSPGGVEVVGKNNQGVSTRTIYSNGTLTVTREVMVVYELVSNRTGTSFLRDITVQLGNKTIRHPSVVITVLKEAEAAADVFVMADVSKKEVFLGEGIVVRYFLYSKVPVNGLDIKKYPKLNSFLKRFLQEPDRTERVAVQGEAYLRSQIYAAKLFPEKLGDLKIDPLAITATYPSSRGNDPFGNFGLNREFKTKSLESESITITVRPVPAPVPAHFTGLVGKHEFNLQLNQQKLIINEPLEVKLTVSGPGALENLEAPTLVKHPGLEEFESTGDLKINDADMATKVFEYTFLAKENLTLPGSKVILSYLDPTTGAYVPHELSLADITVAGGSSAADKAQTKKSESPGSENSKPIALQSPLTLSGPALEDISGWLRNLPLINLGLASLSIILALGWFIKTQPLKLFKRNISIPTEFTKGEFNFGEFARWMSPLIHKTGKSPLFIIQESPLDESSRTYFFELLSAMDKKNYSARKETTTFKYDKAHFKKLAHYIESSKNEDSSQSA